MDDDDSWWPEGWRTIVGDSSSTSSVPAPNPAGLEFSPTDEQLITDYLAKRVLDQTLPPNNNIPEVNIYDDHDPEALLKAHTLSPELYCFTRREKFRQEGYWIRKNKCGGHWKSLGGPKKQVSSGDGEVIGWKSEFVYRVGLRKSVVNTNWFMCEYTLPEHHHVQDIVLCKIYRKDGGQGSSSVQGGVRNDDESKTERQTRMIEDIIPDELTPMTRARAAAAAAAMEEASTHYAKPSSSTAPPTQYVSVGVQVNAEDIDAAFSATG